jgi:hypothetical protein
MPRTLVEVYHAPNGKIYHYYSDGLVSVRHAPRKWTAHRLPDPEAMMNIDPFNDEEIADIPVLADAPRHSADVAADDEYGPELHGDN